MRYVTWIDGVEAVVELVSVTDDSVVARVTPTVEGDEPDAPSREVVFERKVMSDGSWLLNLPDGRSRAVRVLRDAKGGFEMALPKDVRVPVQAMSERDAWLTSGGGSAGHEGDVTVAMPGRVVKILAAVGATVEEGQPLIVIEAMKMENEVKSPRDGVVVSVNVSEGDSVEADEVLMEVGEADGGDVG